MPVPGASRLPVRVASKSPPDTISLYYINYLVKYSPDVRLLGVLEESDSREFCPVREYINVLQEKWVLHIVRALLDGSKGFNELGRGIGGANPRTLSQRLDRLERLGIVEKRVHSTMPPRTEYGLTRAGAERSSENCKELRDACVGGPGRGYSLK